MERRGVPTSRVGMPIRVAVSGPIVDPHGTALFDTNGCHGTSAAAQVRAHSADPTASVVYRWLALIFRSGPPPTIGRCVGSCFSGRLGCTAWPASAERHH